MKPRTKGLLLASVHLAIVLALGGKFLLDRATCPRYWLRTAPIDPDLPIRGRYVRLRVEVPVRDAEPPPPLSAEAQGKPWLQRERLTIRVRLEATPDGLIARQRSQARADLIRMGEATESWPENVAGVLPESLGQLPKDQWTIQLQEPLAFFIPEHVPDPSRRPPGEELWVEATLPRKGPLRPIRLGVKKDGKLVPLEL